MSIFLFSNNASTNLAAPITNTATSLSVTTGAGAEFATPSAGQQQSITMNDAATGLLTEIIYFTTRVGDTISGLLRGQESTTAQNWLAGDLVAQLVTAGQMAAMQQTSALAPARTVTTSGAFTMTTSDAGGGVLLNRLVAPAASSTTLPVSSNGETYAIEDGASNFNAFPVTVNAPGGTTIAGATAVLLNVNKQSAKFRFYADSNTFSFDPGT